jgi:hypothetical protein
VTDPEAAANGGARIFDLKVGLMGTLECGDVVVVAPDHVSRSTETLDIGRRQWCDLISNRERLVRAQPSPARVGIAPPLEFAISLGHVRTASDEVTGRRRTGVNPSHRVSFSRQVHSVGKGVLARDPSRSPECSFF